ncbi:hypothetical protein [Mobilicoccus caccae]|uniref:Uncharacterized protein n=1 Tax=Mobilicoccus caccae TaxID=1859295 RepID=A0ABQ6IJB4_9MICO|nr:hypothetical protein [Mobilicoccus caccae]GMA38005.1 hypothetical protein GCM10025883_00500 [Mobilicoccus caccae]GMA42538.1 hypothetical protein GCM10025883_45830 [Mobilicoccus caccae]
MSTGGGGETPGRDGDAWRDGPQDVRPSDATPAPHERVSGRSAPPSSTGSDDDRRKSTFVKLGITAAVAGAGVLTLVALSGGDDDDEPTHAAVCVDRETGERQPDEQCGDNSGSYHGGFGWYFIPYGLVSPRVGAPVSGGSYSAPASSSYVTGGVSPNGGVVSADTVKGGTKTTVRGGFGGKAKGSGG